MHVEAVREHQRRALLHVGVQVVAIDVALQFVRRQHHHDVGPFGGLGDFHDLELLALGLLDALRGLAQRDRHVLDAGIAQIERMGMALAAIADDGDFLALDQVQVGIPVVINAHITPVAALGRSVTAWRHEWPERQSAAGKSRAAGTAQRVQPASVKASRPAAAASAGSDRRTRQPDQRHQQPRRDDSRPGSRRTARSISPPRISGITGARSASPSDQRKRHRGRDGHEKLGQVDRADHETRHMARRRSGCWSRSGPSRRRRWRRACRRQSRPPACRASSARIGAKTRSA